MNRPYRRFPSSRGAVALRRALALLLLFSLAAHSGASEPPTEAVGTSDFFLQSGSGHQQGGFVGNVNLNGFLGAGRFYDAGFTGSSVVLANIEAGHIWNGHETLSHVAMIPTSGGALGQFDRHATWVGMVMGGRQGGANPGPYQQGIAPDAQLFSGAIATSWPVSSASPRYTASFNYAPNGISSFGPYRAAMVNGLSTSGGLRTADVVNSSFTGSAVGTGLSGTDRFAGVLDALTVENPRTLITIAAGNTLPTGAGPNRVPSPGSAYNVMTVAALTSNGGAFNLPSSFSNGGPNNYDAPSGGFLSTIRQVIDIAAPGESFSLAYYGGETGGNGPGLFGSPDGPAGGPDYYTRNISGTSFAAPTVAGGAALLYDAAYAMFPSNPDARDVRVMKSVLMNSADKTLGWDNGQVAHPNGNGGVFTTRGLDNRVGAGRMNLDAAFDQFLSGTQDVPGLSQGLLETVDALGWDFGMVAEGLTNDYLFDDPLLVGTTFSATLNWFRDRRTSGSTNFIEESQDNLNLELWSVEEGSAFSLISESASIYNNVEHFSFTIPVTGEYMLRVRWAGELFDQFADVNSEVYGLAWAAVAVPEPGALAMLLLAAVAVPFQRRSRGRTA